MPKRPHRTDSFSPAGCRNRASYRIARAGFGSGRDGALRFSGVTRLTAVLKRYCPPFFSPLALLCLQDGDVVALAGRGSAVTLVDGRLWRGRSRRPEADGVVVGSVVATEEGGEG